MNIDIYSRKENTLDWLIDYLFERLFTKDLQFEEVLLLPQWKVGMFTRIAINFDTNVIVGWEHLFFNGRLKKIMVSYWFGFKRKIIPGFN